MKKNVYRALTLAILDVHRSHSNAQPHDSDPRAAWVEATTAALADCIDNVIMALLQEGALDQLDAVVREALSRARERYERAHSRSRRPVS
jgi:hypothetical protein